MNLDQMATAQDDRVTKRNDLRMVARKLVNLKQKFSLFFIQIKGYPTTYPNDFH
jgi:hypothetical protein